MLQEIKTNNVKGFVFSNGLESICKIIEETESTYVVECLRLIIMNPVGELALKPFPNTINDNEKLTVYKNGLTMEFDPESNIVKQYSQLTTTIALI